MSSPEEIKAEIEATRAGLSRDVDALAQTVRPANVAARQKEKVTRAVFGLKDKAGSTVGGAKDAVMGQASQAQSATGDLVQSTGEAISSAPQVARQGAQGNPLAAGLIAFSVGWLAGSLLPATRAEREVAASLKEKAAPLVQEASEMAKDTVSSLQEPAKERLASVRSAGADALQSVKEETSTSASEVAGSASSGGFR